MGGNDRKKDVGTISIYDAFGSEMMGQRNSVFAFPVRPASTLLPRDSEHEKRRREGAAREKERREKEEEKRKEHIRKVTCMDLPLDWENAFACDERARDVTEKSISDALVLSLTNIGSVDIEYIAMISDSDCKTVIEELKGAIYQNPETWGECFYKGWETAEEYLSGNMMRKWDAAIKANKTYDGYFGDNIAAIEKVLPRAVPSKDIYVTLGSPWVPSDIIDDFIYHIHGKGRFPGYDQKKRVKHDASTGTWVVPARSRFGTSVAATRTYGTPKLPALFIIEKTLNMKTVAVYDEVRDLTSPTLRRKVFNKADTAQALEKQKAIIDEFKRWVWLDNGRKERLEIIFENKYSCVRKRSFNGSFLKFPDMSPDVTLFDYQKNAVARILFSPNTLLAHDVGSGKTYVMAAAGMELRRMGLSNKNLYVVPNNIVGQWRDIFKTLYPSAKILCVEPKGFKPDKRLSVLEEVRDGDYDGIIMAYSCFEAIPLTQKEWNEKRKDPLPDARLRYDMVSFDELGVNRLFVDEAHNFKNVPVSTKITRVLGINTKGSAKCRDMLGKVRYVQKSNNGGGVVFATGTPLTNSVTEAYIMQQYLQPGELELLDLGSFDSWIGMFAEKVTEFEVDVDTSDFRYATRFAKFHNLPELTALLSSVADFHQAGEDADIPDFLGYTDVKLPKTPCLADYLNDISSRAGAVRNKLVHRNEDNMLKITTDGRKAALDIRLVMPEAGFSPVSKAAWCAENVCDIYRKTADKKCTQLVFCDSSTPKESFNLYDEVKRLLVGLGVPPYEIAFVHDAVSESKREELFEKMRTGKIRILIGSTFKLGLGVNIQDRLIAIHHLDVPWRPADMTQREGRILRQGNTNERVFIYRYITEGSFDAYSWQLLHSKQRFIAQLLSGSLDERSGSDIEDAVLNYAEVKALAIGNPLVKKRVEAENELSRYRILQRQLVDTRMALECELVSIPSKEEAQLARIADCEDDIAFFENGSFPECDSDERRAMRERLAAALDDNEMRTHDRFFEKYCGFDIILPANMSKKKPCVRLLRKGKYTVELGDSEKGNLIRIDNALESLSERLSVLCENLEAIREKERAIKAELAKNESYSDKIEEYERLIELIDEELSLMHTNE